MSKKVEPNMTDKQAVLELLASESLGRKAKWLGKKLGLSRREANQLLYQLLGERKVMINDRYEWSLWRAGQEPPTELLEGEGTDEQLRALLRQVLR